MAEMWRWGCGWGGSAREAAAMLGARFRAWFWRGGAGHGHWLLGPAAAVACGISRRTNILRQGGRTAGQTEDRRSPAAGASGG